MGFTPIFSPYYFFFLRLTAWRIDRTEGVGRYGKRGTGATNAAQYPYRYLRIFLVVLPFLSLGWLRGSARSKNKYCEDYEASWQKRLRLDAVLASRRFNARTSARYNLYDKH